MAGAAIQSEVKLNRDDYLQTIDKTLKDWSTESPSQREIDSLAKYILNQPKDLSKEESEKATALQRQIEIAKPGNGYENSKEAIETSKQELLPMVEKKGESRTAIPQPLVPTSEEFYAHADKTIESWKKETPTSQEIAKFAKYIDTFTKNNNDLGSEEKTHLRSMQAQVGWAQPDKTFAQSLEDIQVSRLKASWGSVEGRQADDSTRK